MTDTIKILIMGLDNSGKTSIIYTLEQNFANFYSLKPTVSFTVREDFKILGLPIKLWDLGGQKQYRDEYLSKKGFIFGETNLIYFVIDVQDPKRYSEAIEYLQSTIEFLEKIGLPPVLIVMFHKVDPEIKDKKKIRDNIQILENLLSNLPSELDVSYYETTIFDRENLSRAFVSGVFKVLPKTTVIQDSMNDFMANSNSEAVTLLDQNVLIIGEAFTDETKRNICQICGPYFANMIEKLLKYNLPPPTILEAQMEDGWLFQVPFQIEENRFYLVFFSRERSEGLDKINKLIPLFIKDLSNLVKYVV